MYQQNHIRLADGLLLENGEKLQEVEIVYHTFGKYSPEKKVVWVCHALTANSAVNEWWSGLFGHHQYFDKPDYFIICANIIGSCYGSTGPLSAQENGELYYFNFPQLTVRDMVHAHDLLRRKLGILDLEVLIGSSLGGQQAQEFAILLKEKLKKLILIATNACHSAFGIAWNEAQRMAIEADPTFRNNKPDGGKDGLKAARSIAMLSYRSYEGYQKTQMESDRHKTDRFNAAGYQQYQGLKLAQRFNTYSYWYLSKAMDSHNVGRNRISIEWALQEIVAKTLVIGIRSDTLFPLSEQLFLAENIPIAQLEIMDSIFGHDGFLVETEALELMIDRFMSTDSENKIGFTCQKMINE